LRASSGGGLGRFLFNLALNLAGLLAMLGIAGLIGPRPRAAPAGMSYPPPSPDALSFLTWLTVGPPAIALIGALLMGATLRAAWGAPMFNLAGRLGVALAGERFREQALRRLAAAAAIVLVVVPIGYGLIVLGVARRAVSPMRVNWPQAEISRRLSAIWTRETGRPLRIVAGDDWIAGLVGISAADRPSILSRGERA